MIRWRCRPPGTGPAHRTSPSRGSWSPGWWCSSASDASSKVLPKEGKNQGTQLCRDLGTILMIDSSILLEILCIWCNKKLFCKNVLWLLITSWVWIKQFVKEKWERQLHEWESKREREGGRGIGEIGGWTNERSLDKKKEVKKKDKCREKGMGR